MSAHSAPSSDRRPSRPGPSYFAPDLAVTGRIATSGDLEIDGQVDGTVDAQRLKVGPHGRVRASLGAEDAVVSGKVVGVLKARGVTFTDGCHFNGEIQYEQIGMEPAAVVEGRLHPVVDGNARTDVGQTVQTAPRAPAPKAVAARPVPNIPRHTAAAEPAPPTAHPLLKGLVIATVLIAAAVIGALYISPAARDWRAALVESVRQGSAVGGPVVQPPAAAPQPATEGTSTPADDRTTATGATDPEQAAPSKAVVPTAPPKPAPPPLPAPTATEPALPVTAPPAAASPPSPSPAAPAKVEPARVAPAKVEPPQQEPPKPDSAKPEAAPPHPAKPEPLKAAPAKPPATEPAQPAPKAAPAASPRAPQPDTAPPKAAPPAAESESGAGPDPRPAAKPDTPAPQAPAPQPPAPTTAAPATAAPATVRGGAKAEDDGCQWVKQCAPDDPDRCVSVRRCDR